MTTKKPTKSSNSTAPKRSTTKAVVTKPTAGTKAVKPAVVKVAEPGEVTKKDLIERLATESGMKEGEARRALDATLSVLAGAISEGDKISAAPLGKMKIVKKKDTPNGELVVIRLKLKDRKSAAPANKNDPVAKADE